MSRLGSWNSYQNLAVSHILSLSPACHCLYLRVFLASRRFPCRSAHWLCPSCGAELVGTTSWQPLFWTLSKLVRPPLYCWVQAAFFCRNWEDKNGWCLTSATLAPALSICRTHSFLNSNSGRYQCKSTSIVVPSVHKTIHPWIKSASCRSYSPFRKVGVRFQPHQSPGRIWQAHCWSPTPVIVTVWFLFTGRCHCTSKSA